MMRFPRLLTALLMTGVFLLSVVLGGRLFQTIHRQDKLCGVLKASISRSAATVGKPGTPGYDYYRTHPAELVQAHRQNDEFLRTLPC